MKLATPLTLVIAANLAACAPKPEAPAAEAPVVEAAPSIAAFTASENVRPFTIGSLQAAALKDGGADIPNDAKTFAINKTPDDVKALLTEAGLPTDVVSVSVQPLLLRSGDGLLLFDAGLGPANGGTLMASLASAGIDAASVTDIFISHAHFDHVDGLLDATGAPAFPNATVRIQSNEWAAMQANPQQAALVAAITPKVATFEAGAELVPGAVTAIDIKGHTPGHSGYRITSGVESLVYIGDTMHSSIVSVQRPDWTVASDSDAPVAQESRKALLAQAADSSQRIYAVHFPFPGLGKFQRQGDGFVWVAE